MRFLFCLFVAVCICGCFGPPRHLVEPDGVRIHKNITYAIAPIYDGEEKLQLDLYLPETYSKPLPIVVWIHGGGWVNGDRYPCPIAKLATRGYAIASITYRLAKGSKENGFPAALHDCKAAIRWLRVHAWQYGCDEKRIGVWGASAGAHLAALLGTVQDNPELEGDLGFTGVSSRVMCVCALFPATDLLALNKDHPDFWEINITAAALLRSKPEKNPELAKLASPITHVTPDDAPFAFIHGTADEIIPYEQSVIMHTALQKAGVDSTLTLIEGMPHGNATLARPEVRTAAHALFDRYLQPDIPADAPQ